MIHTALIFERYEDSDTDDVTINVLYKEGMQNSTVITLNLDGGCGGVENCPGDSFALLTTALSFADNADWCEACGNEWADQCMEAQLAAHDEDEDEDKDEDDEDDCKSWEGSGVALGMVLGFLLCACFFLARPVMMYVRDKGYCSKSANGGVALHQDEEASKSLGLSAQRQL